MSSYPISQEIFRIEDAIFRVVQGAFWITCKGRRCDYILTAGQQMNLFGKGWVVQKLRRVNGPEPVGQVFPQKGWKPLLNAALETEGL